jgi:4-amino-4-deoxy-L-arabinose transferase-like glycosyltransferase
MLNLRRCPMSPESTHRGIGVGRLFSEDVSHPRNRAGSFFHLWVSMLIAFCVTLVFQGSRGLYESTEGRYAECAREMFITGKYLEPTLDFKAHWTKPPMTYWAIAGGMVLFGKNTWGVRAYLILAFCSTVAIVFLTANYLWKSEVAPYCALIYATSLFPLVGSNSVCSDVLLTLWEALALFSFWAGVRTSKQRYFAMMWVSLGLGFLTKGPPSLIPLLFLIPTYLLMRRMNWNLPSLFSKSGMLLFAVVGFGWYFYESWLHPGLLAHWVKHVIPGHIIISEYSREHARNAQWYKAILIYWPVLIVGSTPWIGLFLWDLKKHPFRLERGYLSWGYWRDKIEWMFVLLSISIPLILFSIVQSKLPLYILPVFVPLSLAMGKYLHGMVSKQRVKSRNLVWIVLVTMVFWMTGKGVIARVPSSKDMGDLAQKVTPFIASSQQRHLYLIGGGNLYGLEFYLDTLLIRVATERELSALIQRDQAAGITSLILVRSKDLTEVQEILTKMAGRAESQEKRVEKEEPATAEFAIDVAPLNRHWKLVRLKEKG